MDLQTNKDLITCKVLNVTFETEKFLESVSNHSFKTLKSLEDKSKYLLN